MDTVTMLRELRRSRLYVAGVCLLAILAGASVVYTLSYPPHSRRYDVGVATARILVNTPSSQIVAVSPRGSNLLGWQADLLASLMVDGAIKSTIAQAAGVSPNQIAGVTDAATVPSAAGPVPVSPPSGRRALVLSTHVLTDSIGDNLPIIELDVQAPTSAGAARLANASIAALTDYLNSEAALERIPDANRLRVTSLGVQSAVQGRGPSTAVAVAVALGVFVLGCAGILAALALIRSWPASGGREDLRAGELFVWDIGPSPDEYVLEPVGGNGSSHRNGSPHATEFSHGNGSPPGTDSPGGNRATADPARSEQGVGAG